jgi:hypothetical protein
MTNDGFSALVRAESLELGRGWFGADRTYNETSISFYGEVLEVSTGLKAAGIDRRAGRGNRLWLNVECANTPDAGLEAGICGWLEASDGSPPTFRSVARLRPDDLLYIAPYLHSPLLVAFIFEREATPDPVLKVKKIKAGRSESSPTCVLNFVRVYFSIDFNNPGK